MNYSRDILEPIAGSDDSGRLKMLIGYSQNTAQAMQIVHTSKYSNKKWGPRPVAVYSAGATMMLSTVSLSPVRTPIKSHPDLVLE